MLLCMRCGTMNDPKENYCTKCGATLPKLAYTMEMASVEEIMDLYYKLADMSSRVLTGQINMHQFENMLAAQMEKQHAMEQELRDLDIDEELWPDFEEEMEIGFTGIDMVNEGMETIALYIDDQNPEHIDRGLEMVKKGSININKANRLNRSRDKKQSHYADLQRMERSIEL